MMNEEKNKNNNAGQQQNDETIRGRTHNGNNPAFEKEDSIRDLNSIDQQEGNMNNGESGGNFTDDEK